MQGISEFLEKGGFFMYINLLCSVVTIAIIVDRAIFFLAKTSVNAKAFLEQIRKLVVANNVDRAVKLCSATSAPVAQVAKSGLQRMHRGELAIAQSIEETLVDVTPLLKKRIQVLWSLANIATRGRHANVLSHMAGHFKGAIEPSDRAELAAVIEDYRRGLVPLVVPLTLVRHHVRAREIEYLADQSYLEPHPKELALRNHV